MTIQDGKQLILEVKNISKRFGGLQAVNDVSFQVKQGEVLGVIGPNGAGKSTTFDLITGVTKPDSGQVLFDNVEVTHKQSHSIMNLGIARTFQKIRLFPSMTVFENVLLGAFGRLSKEEAKSDTLELCESMGLAPILQKFVSEVTLIDRKKIELARAMVKKPRLLFLDEVMCGLNSKEIDEALQHISVIRQTGVTIVFVEHVMKVVMSLSHRVVVLNFGSLIAEGTPAEIRENDKVIEAYLGKSHKKVV